MSTICDLMDMVEKGTVLVFPTEESARVFSVEYVARRGKGLLASSVIAFDRFASIFMPGSAGRKAALGAERILFSEYAASVLSPHMCYFSSPGYPEIRSRLSAFFRPILPSLDDALSIPKKSRRAEEDLRLLRSEYGRYLDSASLYESTFQDISIPEGFEAHYAIIMPSAFPKEERLTAALRGVSGIEVVDDLASPCPDLVVYPNEKSELRALFAAIREKADSGVPLSDIALSVAPLERLRPYIEEEAYLFGIPLDFREGLSPLSTAPGAFLSSLLDIHSSGYSLEALRSFLLNPSIPFRDPAAMRAFVARAVSFSISSAPERRNDRYMGIAAKGEENWYRLFRMTLDSLMAETNPDRIQMQLHTLMSGLLAEDEFRLHAQDADVYAFSMDALSSFLDAARTAEKAGFASGSPLFPVFIDYLKTLRYVPKERIKGVAVYPFTQDAAIPYKYRFIIGLNDKEGSAMVRKASFLSDYELVSEREEMDITQSILSLYSAMTEKLVLSASSETYAGFALPLPSMLPHSLKGSVPLLDPVRAEDGRKRLGTILPSQKEGLDHALLSSLRKPSSDEDMTRRHPGLAVPLPVTLSYTSFNAYRKCPYLYALQYVFSLRDLPAYETADMDHLEIGSRLHSILERYYRKGFSSPDEDVPLLFDEEMAAWSDGHFFQMDGSLGNMPASASRPTAFLIRYLRSRYLHRLIEAVKSMEAISRPLPDGGGIEESLAVDFPESGFSLIGRADRIASALDGSSLILYDYKKGRKFSKDSKAEKSYQFHIYRKMIEASGRGTVSASYFISLLDGGFDPGTPPPSDEELSAALEGTAASIAAGDWHAESSDDNCRGCAYRGVCRRRFSVR